jgi:NADPH2:quinone reductase
MGGGIAALCSDIEKRSNRTGERIKIMKAAWYERQGATRDVLSIGEMDKPQPGAGEVRIRVAFSGINPGNMKKHQDAFGVGMPYPRVIRTATDRVRLSQLAKACHATGSVGACGVMALRVIVPLEPREYTVVALKLVVQLPENVPLEQGACLGIPGITAHRAVHVPGSVNGKTVLVQGGVGADGACAVQLSHQAGARVIATCRAESDKGIASRAGADEVLLTTGNLAERVRASAPDGVNHIVEVAFGANIKTDTDVLAHGGSIATYATNTPMPETPVWQLVFVNARLFFVGSDDVPAEAKLDATRDINKALEAGWRGLDIAEIVPLDQIARAHELVEHPAKPGRVIVSIR